LATAGSYPDAASLNPIRIQEKIPCELRDLAFIKAREGKEQDVGKILRRLRNRRFDAEARERRSRSLLLPSLLERSGERGAKTPCILHNWER